MPLHIDVEPSKGTIKTADDAGKHLAALIDYFYYSVNVYNDFGTLFLEQETAADNLNYVISQCLGISEADVDCIDRATGKFRGIKSSKYSYMNESYLKTHFPKIIKYFAQFEYSIKEYNKKFVYLVDDVLVNHSYKALTAGVIKPCIQTISTKRYVPYNEIFDYCAKLLDEYDIEKAADALYDTCRHYGYNDDFVGECSYVFGLLWNAVIGLGLKASSDKPNKVELYHFVEDSLSMNFWPFFRHVANLLVDHYSKDIIDYAVQYLKSVGYSKMDRETVINFLDY